MILICHISILVDIFINEIIFPIENYLKYNCLSSDVLDLVVSWSCIVVPCHDMVIFFDILIIFIASFVDQVMMISCLNLEPHDFVFIQFAFHCFSANFFYGVDMWLFYGIIRAHDSVLPLISNVLSAMINCGYRDRTHVFTADEHTTAISLVVAITSRTD